MLKNLQKIKPLLRRSSKRQVHKNTYLVALDIGTEYVKALIGKVIENDNIEIIGSGRAHQELSDMQAGAIADIQGVVANCDQALADAEAMAGVSVRTTTIGIAGELVKGTTTTVKVSRKNAEKELDMAEVEKIINIVQSRALERAKAQLAVELGGKDVEIRLVNSALVSIEIDGYVVSNPVGFKGKLVVVKLYTAFAPMIHIGALQRTAKELDLELLAVAAEPFAVARSVIGNDTNSTTSAVLVDAGGGTTDIAVIHEGGVQGTTMFGIGGRAFTKSIERDLQIDFSQAEELKLGLTTNKVPKNKLADIELALGRTLDVWMGGVELALQSFTNIDNLPHKLLLCGGGTSLDMLMSELETSDWYKELAFTRKPSVQHIKPEQVVGIVDKTGTVIDHTYITAMGLLRVGLDTLYTQENQIEKSSIQTRINRILQV